MEGKSSWNKLKECDKIIQRLSIRIPVIVVPVGRNKVHSSMVQYRQLATTYL